MRARLRARGLAGYCGGRQSGCVSERAFLSSFRSNFPDFPGPSYSPSVPTATRHCGAGDREALGVHRVRSRCLASAQALAHGRAWGRVPALPTCWSYTFLTCVVGIAFLPTNC